MVKRAEPAIVDCQDQQDKTERGRQGPKSGYLRIVGLRPGIFFFVIDAFQLLGNGLLGTLPVQKAKNPLKSKIKRDDYQQNSENVLLSHEVNLNLFP